MTILEYNDISDHTIMIMIILVRITMTSMTTLLKQWTPMTTAE